MNSVLQRVYEIGIIPVIAFNSVDEALPLCKALMDGGLPAAEVTPSAGQGSAAAEEVLVQGIADLVLVFDEHAEILDYKTDRSRDAQYYIDEYAAQLRLYRRAFAQRLAVPVTKLTIYSFAIEDEIDVPLA